MTNKICPRCKQGFLYIFFQKDINKSITICDECDAIWLENMEIKYGEYNKDFYDYTSYMNSLGIYDIWQQDNIFTTPLLEDKHT